MERQKRLQKPKQTEAEAVKAQVLNQQDRSATEYLAMQLLEPFVSEDEQDEYQGCDQTFKFYA
jgi:hypothetical protein